MDPGEATQRGGLFSWVGCGQFLLEPQKGVIQINPENVTFCRKVVKKGGPTDTGTLGDVLDSGFGVRVFEKKLEGGVLQHFG